MIEFRLLEDRGVLVLRPEGPLSTSDFERISAAVDPYILKHGRLEGLLIEARAFPGWDSFEAFADHLKFVRGHQSKIRRIAIATDSTLLKLAPKIAEHFAQPEFRTFAGDEVERALGWLETGT